MFTSLGRSVAAGWWVWLIGWALVLVGVVAFAPPWNRVSRSGEFDYLPASSPSRQGSLLLERSFPEAETGSSAIIVVYRNGEKLTDADREFVQHTLVPRLLALTRPGTAEPAAAKSRPSTGTPSGPTTRPLVARVRTAEETGMEPLLDSADGQATLVLVQLETEFMSLSALPLVAKIEEVIDALRASRETPPRLAMALSGSAVVGRDIGLAKARSSSATEFWTVSLVIALLIIIYRAPLLALVPLLTLFVAFSICLKLVALAADAMGVQLFEGLNVYTMVLAYGVGVDYTLFLISRYREELARGASLDAALRTSIAKVGAAIAASAGTGVFGIAMMSFASFGKFRQAGLTIAFSLFVMLCAALTLTPTFLRIGRRWIFWPQKLDEPAGGNDSDRATRRLRSADGGRRERESALDVLWHRAGDLVLRRPGLVWSAAVIVLAPFAALALAHYNELDYGLISQLPSQAPGVVGTDVIRAHFPVGATGPATVLIEDPHVDFSDPDGIDAIRTLTERLMENKDRLQIADIRSVSDPLGTTEREQNALRNEGALAGMAAKAELRERAIHHYVGSAGDAATHVTRMDVLLTVDPFSRESIPVVDHLVQSIRAALPSQLAGGTRLYPVGPSASIRDLNVVADRDRLLINGLVLVVVLLVLFTLRLGIGVALYLVATVVFSYLVSLGVTFETFRRLDPQRFAGLCWTVPLFLFTILVAIGVDYNILLVSRVREESERHGRVRGVAEALGRTGTIISSCGIIMAGTFSSLLIGGRLAEMEQLGFALSFGILLDTFVVRPLLVPSFLTLLYQRLGRSPASRTRASEPESGLSSRAT